MLSKFRVTNKKNKPQTELFPPTFTQDIGKMKIQVDDISVSYSVIRESYFSLKNILVSKKKTKEEIDKAKNEFNEIIIKVNAAIDECLNIENFLAQYKFSFPELTAMKIKLFLLGAKINLFTEVDSVHSSPPYILCTDAMIEWQNNSNFLFYEKDYIFQEEIEFAFYVMRNIYQNKNDKEYKDFLSVSCASAYIFSKLCGDSVTRLSILFFNLSIDVHVTGKFIISKDADLLQKEFITVYQNRLSSFESQKKTGVIENKLRLDMIKTYLFGLQFKCLMHNDTIWTWDEKKQCTNTISTIVSETTEQNFKSYFKRWREDWRNQLLQASVDSLTEVNRETLSVNAELTDYFKRLAIDLTMSVRNHIRLFMDFKKRAEFLKNNFGLKCEINNEIEYLQNLSTKLFSFLGATIVSETNNQYLVELASLQKTHQACQQEGQRLYQLEQETQKQKVQEANDHFKELVKQEEEDQRKLISGQLFLSEKNNTNTPNNFFRSSDEQGESSNESDENKRNTLNIVTTSNESTVKRKLENIDKDVLSFATNLSNEVISVNKIFLEKLHNFHPLSNNQREELWELTREIILNYYRLLILFEEHKELSQTDEIRSDDTIQYGISFGQSDIKKYLIQIEENMNGLLSNFEELNKKIAEERAEFLYKLGVKYATLKGLDVDNLTYDQIIKYGIKAFSNLGQPKQESNMSDHSKDKKTFEDLQPYYHGLSYIRKNLGYTRPEKECSSLPLYKLSHSEFQLFMAEIYREKFNSTHKNYYFKKAMAQYHGALKLLNDTNDSFSKASAYHGIAYLRSLSIEGAKDESFMNETMSYYEKACKFYSEVTAMSVYYDKAVEKNNTAEKELAYLQQKTPKLSCK